MSHGGTVAEPSVGFGWNLGQHHAGILLPVRLIRPPSAPRLRQVAVSTLVPVRDHERYAIRLRTSFALMPLPQVLSVMDSTVIVVSYQLNERVIRTTTKRRDDKVLFIGTAAELAQTGAWM